VGRYTQTYQRVTIKFPTFIRANISTESSCHSALPINIREDKQFVKQSRSGSTSEGQCRLSSWCRVVSLYVNVWQLFCRVVKRESTFILPSTAVLKALSMKCETVWSIEWVFRCYYRTSVSWWESKNVSWEVSRAYGVSVRGAMPSECDEAKVGSTNRPPCLFAVSKLQDGNQHHAIETHQQCKSI
jgi:hypothetical protein